MSGSKTASISSTTSSSAKSALVELASSSSASPSSNAAARRVETTPLATASPSALLSKSAQRLEAGVGHTRDLRQAALAPGQRHGSLPGHAPRALRERTSASALRSSTLRQVSFSCRRLGLQHARCSLERKQSVRSQQPAPGAVNVKVLLITEPNKSKVSAPAGSRRPPRSSSSRPPMPWSAP